MYWASRSLPHIGAILESLIGTVRAFPRSSWHLSVLKSNGAKPTDDGGPRSLTGLDLASSNMALDDDNIVVWVSFMKNGSYSGSEARSLLPQGLFVEIGKVASAYSPYHPERAAGEMLMG